MKGTALAGGRAARHHSRQPVTSGTKGTALAARHGTRERPGALVLASDTALAARAATRHDPSNPATNP